MHRVPQVIIIILVSLIFTACLQDKKQSNSFEPIATEVELPQTLSDQTDNDSQETQETTDLSPQTVETKASKKIHRDYEKLESESIIKKGASTIAEQQAAARKIQDELLQTKNDSPSFVKVINTQSDISKPEKTKPENIEVTSKQTPKESPKTKKKSKKKLTAKIDFEDYVFNFDTIQQGDIITHKFMFKNNGKAPLEVKSASATCGCTQPSYPFMAIEPGDEGFIEVRYNSVGKAGSQEPLITVNTNASKEPITLKMEGFVTEPIKKDNKSN